MSFQPWDAAKSGIVLPINGTDYTIPPLGHLDAIRIRAYMVEITKAEAEQRPVDPELVVADTEFLKMVLGDALEQMKADNVPDIAITHAAYVAELFNTAGRTEAEKAWAEGLDPEALAASMKAAQDRAAALRTASTPSPDTESASPTPSASTTATTSPTTTPRSPAKRKAGKSPGRKSSPAKNSSSPTSPASTDSDSTNSATT